MKSLNMQENKKGVYICKGIMERVHPTYFLKESLLAQKIIFAEHKRTLHGGVTITMTSVKPRDWISSPWQQCLLFTNVAGAKNIVHCPILLQNHGPYH